jgi:glutathione peroxidase
MLRLLIALAALLLTGSPPQPAQAEAGVHAFSFTAIKGGPLPLQRFADRPILIVNTASMGGFTYQYSALQRVWERYREAGLVVLGVPSNDFGGQEPGSSEEIKSFCEANFDVDFPMTEKVSVRGSGSHPLFVWLRQQLGEGTGPRWNFHKYLVDRHGSVIGSWPSSVEPDAPEMTAAIERALRPAS